MMLFCWIKRIEIDAWIAQKNNYYRVVIFILLYSQIQNKIETPPLKKNPCNVFQPQLLHNNNWASILWDFQEIFV
jgi:hypothetical protein